MTAPASAPEPSLAGGIPGGAAGRAFKQEENTCISHGESSTAGNDHFGSTDIFMDLGCFAMSTSCYQSKFKKCEKRCFQLTAPPCSLSYPPHLPCVFFLFLSREGPGQQRRGPVKGLFGWASLLLSCDALKRAWIWLWGQEEDME